MEPAEMDKLQGGDRVTLETCDAHGTVTMSTDEGREPWSIRVRWDDGETSNIHRQDGDALTRGD